MAIRNIRIEGDPILGKISKPVVEMSNKLLTLIDDMFDTMYEANGVGLAAPQVGILKRIIVMDVSEDGDEPIVMINPEIIDRDGSQTGEEGCLSAPGKSGVVTRSEYVKVRAFDENMQIFELEGNGLLARCIQHEIDHLEGIMYTSKVEGEISKNQ